MERARTHGKHLRPQAEPWAGPKAVLIALAAVVCCYAICFAFGSPSFLTNDDTGIQYGLSGVYTGAPFPIQTYANVFVSYPLSLLYTVLPRIPWWFCYSHALLCTGMTITNIALCGRIAQMPAHRVAAYTLLLCFDCALVMHSIACISFTVVPATLMAAIACVLATSQRRLRAREVAALIALLTLAFCHRPYTVYATAPFVALALLRHVYEHHTLSVQTAISVCKALVPALALLACITMASNAVKARANGPEFAEYNAARSSYMDYPHDSYRDNPELFESVGWDENLYELVRRWCFIDPRVNTSTFSTLVARSNTKARMFDAGIALERLQILGEDNESFFTIGFFVCVAILGLLVCIGDKRHTALWIVASTLAASALLFYQLYLGRILYRTVVIEVICGTALNLALLYGSRKDGDALTGVRRVAAVLCLTTSLALSTAVASVVFGAERLETLAEINMFGDASLSYASEHQGNIYIRTSSDINLSRNPFANYAGRQPNNCVLSLISSTPPAVYATQLKSIGLSQLTGETFRRNNVYYMTRTKPDRMEGEERTHGQLVYKWLSQHYGATGYELVDTIDETIYVYHFDFE